MRKHICLLIVGENVNFPVGLVVVKLQETFGFDVRIKEDRNEPIYAYDARRHQYNSASILRHALDRVDDDCIKLIAITDVDLCTPILDFIFGEAQLDGKVAVLSSKRLRQEFYGLEENIVLFTERLLKEISHELGHTFGLAHCPRSDCVMNLSTNIVKLDEKGSSFCDACFERLRRKTRSQGP